MIWDIFVAGIAVVGVGLPGAMIIRSSRKMADAMFFALLAASGAVGVIIIGDMPIAAWTYYALMLAMLALGYRSSRPAPTDLDAEIARQADELMRVHYPEATMLDGQTWGQYPEVTS